MNLVLFILLSIFIFFLFIKVSHIIGFVDKPNFRKKHKASISLAGGVSIFISLIFFIFIRQIEFSHSFLAIFFFLIILIGLVDDKFDMNPTLKLFLIFFILFLFFYFNEEFLIRFIRIDSYGVIKFDLFFAFFFSILCFSLFIHAMNMIDGINGLSSLIFIFFINFLIFKLDNSDFYFLYYINVPLIIFLIFNLTNKIFLGDHGIYLLSFLTSCLSVKVNFFEKMHSEQLFLLFMIPGIDMLRLFLIRIKNKKHPFSPDNNHIHHILCNKFNNFFAVAIILVLVIVPSIIDSLFGINTWLIIITNLILYIFLISNFKFNRIVS